MRLYHQTKKENIESILKYGLIPNKIGIVYLSPMKNVGFGEITLEIETGKNNLTAFEDCKEWEVLCWGRIPPSSIKLKKPLSLSGMSEKAINFLRRQWL